MNKERATKDIVVRVTPTLHAKLQKKCLDNYKTISEVIRDFIVHFVRDQGTIHSATAAMKAEFSCKTQPTKVVEAAGVLKPKGGFLKAETGDKVVSASAVLKPFWQKPNQ